MSQGPPFHVAVVGGGISGLAAAWFLHRDGEDLARVTVLEGSSRIGGKLHVSDVAGLPVDEGAEAMLARRPEGRELAAEVGLRDRLTDPVTSEAAIWTRGAFRPMPKGQVMGIPGDLVSLARSGVLSPAGLARVQLDAVLPATPVDGDVPVAAYVRARVGSEVVDRLVEPLLGGVYAGRAEDLSLQATMPRIAEAARARRSLTAAAREIAAEAPKDAGPVFSGLAGGLGTLPEAVAEASRARIRTRATVRELRRTPYGWRLTVGPARAPEAVDADAVIVATPATPAGRLLEAEAPSAVADLAAIEYASMAIVTLVYPRTAFPAELTGSGYLVPPVDDRAVKAVTFSGVKWEHLAEADRTLVAVRCSIGRVGEEHLLQRDDSELVAMAMAELAETVGVRGLPRGTRVTRWGGALPQYAVGHLDRVARVRGEVARLPGLAVCGAAYDGLGVPACVATARTAVARVLGHLRGRREYGDDPKAQGA